MKNNLKSAGFTLIELLVVIAIISLLSAVVLASLNSARDKARVARAASDLKQITLAVSMYLNSNGTYPCFDHTYDDIRETNWSAPYLKWPTNPWGGNYHWEDWSAFIDPPNNGFYGGIYYGNIFSISVWPGGLANAQALDKFMDDNSLSTGIILGTGDRLEYRVIDNPAISDHNHCVP